MTACELCVTGDVWTLYGKLIPGTVTSDLLERSDEIKVDPIPMVPDVGMHFNLSKHASRSCRPISKSNHR
jgi:hypothetical protein